MSLQEVINSITIDITVFIFESKRKRMDEIFSSPDLEFMSHPDKWAATVPERRMSSHRLVPTRTNCLILRTIFHSIRSTLFGILYTRRCSYFVRSARTEEWNSDTFSFSSSPPSTARVD